MGVVARNWVAILGVVVVVVTTVLAVLAPAVAPADPIKNSLLDRLTPPMWTAGKLARNS